MRTPLVALALAVVSVSSTATAADKPPIIRFGVAGTGTGGRPATGGGFVPDAADAGALEREFRKDGIEVKYTYFSGAGPAVNEALANRQIDFASQGDLPALVARSGGLPTRLILASGRFYNVYVVVPSDSTARTLEELKGKRIAVFKGTAIQLAFAKILAARGLKETDFKIINMSTYDGNAALLSKDIDAQVSMNDVFPLVDRGVARIIYSNRGDPRLGMVGHVLVTEDFSARYPDVVQRVVNVLLKTAAWEADEANRAKAYQIWTKSGLNLSAWKNEYDAFALRDRNSPLFDEFYYAQYKRQLKAARDLKLVRKDFDIDQWIDPTYLNRGLKELGLAGTWREFDADGKPKTNEASASASASR